MVKASPRASFLISFKYSCSLGPVNDLGVSQNEIVGRKMRNKNSPFVIKSNPFCSLTRVSVTGASGNDISLEYMSVSNG